MPHATAIVTRAKPSRRAVGLRKEVSAAQTSWPFSTGKPAFYWKTGGRGISRLSRNSDEEIADALRSAIAAQTERSAVAVLVGLNGVRVPVASSILTAINSDRYTIIDDRALEALGIINATSDINLYLAYLGFCRHLAAGEGVSLRDLDRALWQWSKERAQVQR